MYQLIMKQMYLNDNIRNKSTLFILKILSFVINSNKMETRIITHE